MLIFSALAPQARAADLSTAEIQTLADYYKKYVHVVTKPFYIYSWSPTASQYSTVTTASSPDAVKNAQAGIPAFWNNLNKKDKENVLGPGLYAASDPTYTRGFGKTDPALLQIRVDRGFRMLDFQSDDEAALEDAAANPTVWALLRKAHCRDLGAISSLFTNTCPVGTDMTCPKTAVPDSCVRVLKAVFNDNLEISGLAYSYGASTTNECGELSNTNKHDSSFVITKPEALTTENTKIFTRFTQDALNDRLRIQSQMHELDPPNGSPTVSKLPNAEPPNFFQSDLTGKPYDLNVSKWNKENLYACSTPPQYVSLKEYEASQAAVQDACKAPPTDNTQVNIQDLGKVVKKACDQTSNE